MARQSTLDVSKWQAARPRWAYQPVLWFYHRMIEVAYLDACTQANGAPSDAALLARDWIACSQPGRHEFVSFPECCEMLGLDPETERLGLLGAIDAAVDMDTDDAWARLADLAAHAPQGDLTPLFNAPRVVRVLDQMTLW